MLARMDAAQAIAGLTEISPQVRRVVVIDADGAIIGSNVSDDAARRLADGARTLLEEADAVRPEPVAQLEAATTAGSVFVVRDGDRMIAATTTPEPTVGLVFYDLKSCLRSVDEPPAAAAPKRRPARKKADDAAA
jgi:predicted regulator of Ras-like GTPase activity (Roadblock/LC7/MglB family)